jgi:hypothetical protein
MLSETRFAAPAGDLLAVFAFFVVRVWRSTHTPHVSAKVRVV